MKPQISNDTKTSITSTEEDVDDEEEYHCNTMDAMNVNFILIFVLFWI